MALLRLGRLHAFASAERIFLARGFRTGFTALDEKDKSDAEATPATPAEAAAATEGENTASAKPTRKTSRYATRMAYRELQTAPVSKDAILSFRKRDELFTLHQADPVKWTFEALGEKYGILPRRALAIVQLKKLELEAEKSGWEFTNSLEDVAKEVFEQKDKLNELDEEESGDTSYDHYVIAPRPLDHELIKKENKETLKSTFAQHERERWKFEDTVNYIRSFGEAMTKAKSGATVNAEEAKETTDAAGDKKEKKKEKKDPNRSKWTFIEAGTKRLDGSHVTPSTRAIKILETTGELREANQVERTFINVVYKTTPVHKVHRRRNPMKIRRIERILSVLD